MVNFQTLSDFSGMDGKNHLNAMLIAAYPVSKDEVISYLIVTNMAVIVECASKLSLGILLLMLPKERGNMRLLRLSVIA